MHVGRSRILKMALLLITQMMSAATQNPSSSCTLIFRTACTTFSNVCAVRTDTPCSCCTLAQGPPGSLQQSDQRRGPVRGTLYLRHIMLVCMHAAAPLATPQALEKPECIHSPHDEPFLGCSAISAVSDLQDAAQSQSYLFWPDVGLVLGMFAGLVPRCRHTQH